VDGGASRIINGADPNTSSNASNFEPIIIEENIAPQSSKRSRILGSESSSRKSEEKSQRSSQSKPIDPMEKGSLKEQEIKHPNVTYISVHKTSDRILLYAKIASNDTLYIRAFANEISPNTDKNLRKELKRHPKVSLEDTMLDAGLPSDCGDDIDEIRSKVIEYLRQHQK
jgi:hypothetical protein